MGEPYRISAIIPLFNGEAYIGKSIDSLLGQSIPIDEIIIIDDKSTDQSLATVRALKKGNEKIKIFHNSINKGSSYSRNLGIKKSSGNYLLFLDQDDYISPDFVKEILGHLIKVPSEMEVAAIHTSYFIVDDHGCNPIFSSVEAIDPDEFLGYQFVRNRILSNSGTVVKKSILKQVGVFDESLKFSQDWDLWLRIGRVGIFNYLPKPLTYIRRHKDNTSNNIDGFLRDEKSILKKYDLKFIESQISGRRLSNYLNSLSFISILLRLGEYEIIEDRLKKINPDDNSQTEHHFYFGLHYYYLRKLEMAVLSFNQVSSDSSYYHSAQNNLSAIYILKNDKKSAYRVLNKLLKNKPNFQDALHNLKLLDSLVLESSRAKITTRPLRNILYSYRG
jgi:glycosyltransferase involved in cell wall biosynthesis